MQEIFKIYEEIANSKNSWSYYENANCYLQAETLFIDDQAKLFVDNYFSAGGKIQIFKNEKDLLGISIDEERYNHTLSTFLLGISIKKGLNLNYCNNKDIVVEDDYKKFLYFWYMTCLFHDMGYYYENKSSDLIKTCKSIDDFLKETKISKDLLFETSNPQLIENYFCYRVSECGKIDHGIAGGLLMYNGLMKIYYDVKKLIPGNKSRDFVYEDFYYNPCNFIKPAEDIIQHNIWRANDSETEEKYKKYGLSELCKQSSDDFLLKYCKTTLELFLLAIADTIEPIKNFPCEAPKTLMKKIELGFEKCEKILTIKIVGDLEYKEYFCKIRSMQDWIDVDITVAEEDRTIAIKING